MVKVKTTGRKITNLISNPIIRIINRPTRWRFSYMDLAWGYPGVAVQGQPRCRGAGSTRDYHFADLHSKASWLVEKSIVSTSTTRIWCVNCAHILSLP